MGAPGSVREHPHRHHEPERFRGLPSDTWLGLVSGSPLASPIMRSTVRGTAGLAASPAAGLAQAREIEGGLSAMPAPARLGNFGRRGSALAPYSRSSLVRLARAVWISFSKARRFGFAFKYCAPTMLTECEAFSPFQVKTLYFGHGLVLHSKNRREFLGNIDCL
jgi:hypothetical protein